MRTEVRAVSAALVALLAACKPYVMTNSAVEQFPKADQEIEFLAAVEKMPAVTNNDALHAMLILQDGDDRSADYQARRAEGVRRRWIDAGALANPNEAAKVGWMATAGCRVMEVKGGLTMHLVGPIPRYATRELVYMEILPLRTENQVLTGAEFVDYLNRLGRLAGKNRRDKPESPLGVPAGESAFSPGNEGAIQEGQLPQQGPREAAPASAPAPAGAGSAPGEQPAGSQGGASSSGVPGKLNAGKPKQPQQSPGS